LDLETEMSNENVETTRDKVNTTVDPQWSLFLIPYTFGLLLGNIPTLLHLDTTDPLVVVVHGEVEGLESEGIS